MDHGIHATTRLEWRTAALQFVPLLWWEKLYVHLLLFSNILMQVFVINIPGKDQNNVSQIHTKKTKFLTLAKKKTWSIIKFGCYSCLLTYFNFWTLSPINFFRKYPKYRPTFYWGFIGLNPLPLWKFQFTFMLSFRNFGLLEKILRFPVMRICKDLTIKIIRDRY